MRNRSLFLTGAVAAILVLLFWKQAATQTPITMPQLSPAADELQAFTLIFGAKDKEATQWDGSASLSSGKIEKIVGYHFTPDSKVLDGNAWQCASHPWANFSAGMHPNEKPQPMPTAFETIGVTIYLRGPASAELQIKVPKGEFSFRLLDVPETAGIFPYGAKVEVYRTPVIEKITTDAYENDYPSIASSGDKQWVAWQAYKNESDVILLKERVRGTWGQPLTVSEKPGDFFGTAMAAGGGKAMVVWSGHEGEAWQLKARTYDGSRFSKTETITTGIGHNLFHHVAADAKGNFYVVYQSWRKGRSDIYLRSCLAGVWGKELNLSDPKRDIRADDWAPAVAVDRSGVVWVAWDGYAAGNYNIYLRSVRNNVPGALVPVTTSTRFHAHASLAVDAQDRLWIAYDEAPENWGKDVGFLFAGGTGLYQSRAIKVAVYATGRWLAPLRQPDDVVPWGIKRYFQTPRLVADSTGHMWLFARPRTSARVPTTLWAAGGKWEVFATYYDGDRWSELIPVPDTVGRNEGDLQAAADAKGNVYLAAVSDHKLYGGKNFGEPPGNNDIMFASTRTVGQGSLRVAARGSEPPAGLASEPSEKQDVARLRQHVIQVGGKTYHIYRGDMHRHTEISLDGAGDGSLWDVYRYAINAASLDFLLVTDHQDGEDQEYPWWRIEKSADMFHIPGYFTAFYGTERSLNYPNGHRNLLFTKRGVHTLPITPAEQKSSTGPVLYPYLRLNNGIAMSHTSATGMGTDWRDNDKDLEPLVEIFQGARTSAETDGGPLASSEKRTELWAGGYKPLGFVWNAWAKGYKLGVQASSDHVSTHLSYSCIIAENQGREALAEAMRKRHSYAATRNILLDYRMTADGNTYLQGDIFSANSMPELTATIVGAGAALAKVVVVRDNQYVYTQEPKESIYHLRYKENSLTPGEHYYYVRAEQADGKVAWSSPIWITYTAK
jgi:hypothetical protein